MTKEQEAKLKYLMLSSNIKLDKEDFEFTDGYANLPRLPGLGVDVDKDLVIEENKTPHSWKNPVWRHKDGSVAEW